MALYCPKLECLDIGINQKSTDVDLETVLAWITKTIKMVQADSRERVGGCYSDSSSKLRGKSGVGRLGVTHG